MTRHTIFYLLFVCALLSCSLELAQEKSESEKEENSAWWEEETVPPNPDEYDINLNAINKKEAAEDTATYADNPLLGYEWLPGSGGGFTYFYKKNGTVSSTHHCELLFDDQFSYFIYRNFLLMYGQEMSSGERLEAWTLHPAGNSGEIVMFKRGVADGAIITYDIYSRNSTDSSPEAGAAATSPPYTPFLGTWTAGEDPSAVVYEFTDNGIYTAGGEKFGYLARGDKFVTVNLGETEFSSTDGALLWKTFPSASEQTFTITNGGATITFSSGLTLAKQQTSKEP
ncbi:MAG: hypothetical protein LBJ35_02485 [Spirochaetaceae bacterium]|jgi:hypothetical protein|nr:hypothetical protein [Spirochaetaceae bacterium]